MMANVLMTAALQINRLNKGESLVVGNALLLSNFGSSGSDEKIWRMKRPCGRVEEVKVQVEAGQ